MNLSTLTLLGDQERSSIYWTVIIMAFFIIATIYFRLDGYETYGFAEEIGNVAASVANGSGFAQTFGEEGGATAWCPPLYVLYYAFIFKLFGIKTVYAYWGLYISRAIILSFAFFLLVRIDYSKKFNRYKIILVPLFLVYALLVEITKKSDDVFLHIFLSAAILFAFSKILEYKKLKPRWLFYTLCVIIPFSNISFFMGFLIVALFLFLSGHARLSKLQVTLAVSILFLGVITWGLRNSNVLDKFIPFKSNLWFELYLANVVDNDGISKWSNFRKYHPLGNPDVYQRYKQLGEITFLEEYQAKSIEYLKNETPDFLKKISNRLKEAFLFTTSQIDTELADIESFNSTDLEKLRDADLIKLQFWVCMELQEQVFIKKMNKLALIDAEPVITDWMTKQEIVKERVSNRQSVKDLIRTFAIGIIPFIAILLGLTIKQIRTNKIFLLNLVLYSISIGPYILVSFLPRYQFFQMTFHVVFVFLSLAYMMMAIEQKYRHHLFS